MGRWIGQSSRSSAYASEVISRAVEELLAERGIEVSYETIRCWTIKFGPLIATNLRRPAPCPVRPLASMGIELRGRSPAMRNKRA